MLKFIRMTHEHVINHIVDTMVWKFPNSFCAELLHNDRVSTINALLSEYAYHVGN